MRKARTRLMHTEHQQLGLSRSYMLNEELLGFKVHFAPHRSPPLETYHVRRVNSHDARYYWRTQRRYNRGALLLLGPRGIFASANETGEKINGGHHNVAPRSWWPAIEVIDLIK